MGCSGLEEMIIPETTVLIDTNAFTGCTSLTEITIPANVKKIENSVFLGCSSLENINVDNNNLNYKSIDGALYSKDGKDLLTYPAGKTGVEYTVETGTIRLASCSFNDCLNLIKITIPASVEFIGQAIFAGCSNLEVINVDKDNERYKSVDGVVYSKDGTSLDFCPSGKKGDLIIEEGVTRIFVINCSKLEKITIPKSVTSLSYSEFSGCNSLKEVIVDENNPNYKSVDGVLYSKDGSTLVFCPLGKTGEYKIETSATHILGLAFFNCKSLTKVIIPRSVTNIYEAAFRGCDNLTIYAEVASKPSGWHQRWNRDYRPVVWGYQE